VFRELSILIPVYNEEENVLPLLSELRSALAHNRLDYEIILVDDCSTDATWWKIMTAHQNDPRVRGLRHAHNAGQSAALWTGIQNSSAPLIATLDGDLQNDPADIPRLLTLLNESDFVCGVRQHRKDNLVRRLSSRVARHARRWALGVDFCDTGCALRVFRRQVLDGIFLFNGLHRFLPVLVHDGGWRVREAPINHRPRVAGLSKYGLCDRLWRGIFDLFAVAWYQRRRVPHIPACECQESFRMENAA
jgi:dolichol-phosphate mannosyltransferase